MPQEVAKIKKATRPDRSRGSVYRTDPSCHLPTPALPVSGSRVPTALLRSSQPGKPSAPVVLYRSTEWAESQWLTFTLEGKDGTIGVACHASGSE